MARQCLQQHNAPVLNLEISAVFQVFEYAAHHFAAAADAAGNLLVGHALCDAAGAISLRCGQAQQAFVQTPVNIDKGQIPGAGGCQAHAPNHGRQQYQCKLGPLGDEVKQGGAGDQGAHGRLLCNDAGRARPAVQCHFSKILARTHYAKSDFLVCGIRAKHFYLAGKNDE